MLDAFDDVPVFVAVVEAGGFSRAAGRLGVTRSAVGKAVARLEERLGARLFHRTTRSQSLTEDGQVFFEHCQRALGELTAGKALVESGRITVRGKLRISMPVLFGRLCVAPVLTRLTAKHPDLELDLSFSDRIIDLIEDGFDLAVRSGAVGHGAGLMLRRIARQQKMVVASPKYLKRHGTPRALAQLSTHHAVAYGRSGRVQPWLFSREGASPEQATPPARLRFDDLEAIADAAVAGVGLAWLPSWLVRDRLRTGALVQVLSEFPAQLTDLHLVWPASTHLATRVRVAIDALAAEAPRFSA